MAYSKVPKFLASGPAAFRWAKKNTDFDPDSEYVREETEELERRADLYSDFAYGAYNDGRIQVHRKVRVSVLDGVPDIDFECLGKAWSAELRGAGVYGSVGDLPGKTEDVLITGEVKPRNVDWEYGFASFVYYGEDQWEVSMLPDSPVLVTKIDGRTLDEPIEGSTGPAGEIWADTCRRKGG